MVVPEWLQAGRRWPGLRIVSRVGRAGIDPNRCGLGLVPATERALQGAGIGVTGLGTVEIVEAFAGQVLAGTDALEISEHLICPDGGALAIGTSR